MGLCASSEIKNCIKYGGRGSDHCVIKQYTSTIKIIHMDGKLQELKQPIKASHLTSQNPSCFLCSSESMSIGKCVPHVPDEEDLQPGQIYFLLPLSLAHKTLSLPDLCALAIKASSALGQDIVDFTSTNSKLIFR